MSDVPECGPNELNEEGDDCVPADLIEIHVSCEEADVTPEQFKEAFGGNEAGN